MAEDRQADLARVDEDAAQPMKPMPPAAQRALAEAAVRREEYRKEEAARPKEIGGRGGQDPERYGDWEVKGITSDF